jgi:CTP:molybdopterin cytidylyltransferase MocA
MVGTAPSPGPAVCLVEEARRAAALDTLVAADAIGLFDHLIVVTNDPHWAGRLPSNCSVDVDETSRPFHLGRRLAEVIDRHSLTHVLYMGAGAAPLLSTAELGKAVESVLARGQGLVTNNLHSSDWVVFAPGDVLAGYVDRVARDNSLAWVLHREAELPAEWLPPTAASRLDIDTPADLLVLARHPGCGQHLASYLAKADLDTGRLDRAMRALRTEGTHILVAGRVASSTWAALERDTLCWVRLLAEERGMVASGRQAGGQVRSLLGAYLEQVGMDRLVGTMEEWAEAVFWDNRVLLAHFGLWPSAEDRFASDLGWADQVTEPMLRELTERVAAASVPIIMGGHTLVSGGLLALLDAASQERWKGEGV